MKIIRISRNLYVRYEENGDQMLIGIKLRKRKTQDGICYRINKREWAGINRMLKILSSLNTQNQKEIYEQNYC